jgi:hypothetical protein
MSKHKRIYEGLKIVAVAPPALLTSTPRVSGAVNMSKFSKVFAVLSLGDMAAEAIDFRLESSTTDSTFTGVVTTRVSATQLAASATANDNKQVVLEVDASQLNGDLWLRSRAVTSGTTGGMAEVMLFGVPLHSTQAQLDSVLEVKSA